MLVLTPEGRHLVDDATEALNTVFADPGLEPDDTATLIDVLTRFRSAAGDF